MRPDKMERRSTRTVEPLVSEVHPELFHYTSTTALRGILGTNTLWATAATHLNDLSEMKLIWEQLEKPCMEYVDDAIRTYIVGLPDETQRSRLLDDASSIATTDGKMIANVMRTRLLGDDFSAGMGIPYITSFTTHTDTFTRENGMLSQWRAYGAGEPVAIVVPTKDLERLLKAEYAQFEYFSCALADAVYLDVDFSLKDYFPDFLDALRMFAQHVIQQKPVSDIEVLRNTNRLATKLLPAVGRVKHFAFREENECRIIAGLPHESLREEYSSHGEQAKPFKPIRHRAGRTNPIPYIRLFEKLDETIPIDRIIVGPSANQQAIIDSVSSIINSSDRHTAISIEASEIPYVGSA